MKRLLLGGTAFAMLLAAVVFSNPFPSATSKDAGSETSSALKIEAEAKNPWTNLKLNDSPDQFQFAVVSDRTGGHRAKVFSRAVQQVNLLQPSFVMSVGDLIEGYTKVPETVDKEWNEFDSYTKQFNMPFFYVVGNHDITNPMQEEKWKERYGRRHYHFVYKNVLFVAVNCEDPPGKTALSAEQVADLKKALDANPKVRWTFLFVHKPIWTAKDLETNGWKALEDALGGRKYTVFCGHEHRYVKYLRNGMAYYQLATTGGGSRMRGVPYGEFDHVAWVTVKPSGEPLIANVLLDGILPENLSTPDSDELGTVRKTVPTFSTRVTVALNGQPVAGATVTLSRKTAATATAPAKWTSVSDGLTTADGTTLLSTYTAFDGAPAGEFVVTVVKYNGYRAPEETRGENQLPAKYATPAATPLKITIQENTTNEAKLDLTN